MNRGSQHLARRAAGPTFVLISTIWGWNAWGKSGLTNTQDAPAASVQLAASGCGSLEDLNDHVMRRSTQIRLARRSEQGPQMRAEIRKLGAGRKAIVLSVINRSGQRFVRRMRAEGCDEALEALAFLIVLALDPGVVAPPRPARDTANPTATALAGEVSPAGAAASRADATTERQEAVATDKTTSGPASPRRSKRVDLPSLDGDKEPARTSPGPGNIDSSRASSARSPAPVIVSSVEEKIATKQRQILAGGGSAAALVGPVPGAMLGGFLYALWGWDRDSLWSPSVTLSAGHLERNGVAAVGGTADFALNVLQLDVCPIWVGMQRRLSGRACASGSTGRLTSRGLQTLAAETHRSSLTAFGGSASLRFLMVERLELVATGGFAFPLQRYAFQFEPGIFYRGASVSVEGGISVGFRFF